MLNNRLAAEEGSVVDSEATELGPTFRYLSLGKEGVAKMHPSNALQKSDPSVIGGEEKQWRMMTLTADHGLN